MVTRPRERQVTADTRESGREESPEERQDRLFADELQELRVMQTGAQLLAGFLVTLPFQSRFAEMDRFQLGVYVVLVVLAALTTTLLLTPVAVHRHLTGRHIKSHVVKAAHRCVQAALTTLSLLLSGMLLLVIDMVAGRVWGILAAAGALCVSGLLLVVMPRVVARLGTSEM